MLKPNKHIALAIAVMAALFVLTGYRVAHLKKVNSFSNPTVIIEENKLLVKLTAYQHSGIMIGHQDDLAYGIGWKSPKGQGDVYRVAGDYPAVFGWDLGGIENSSAYNLDSVAFADIKRFARFADSLGGINTFSWHIDNPVTGNDSWKTGDKTIVREILPGGSHHNTYKVWLDKVAAFFTELKDAKGNPIDVIFRPFHEHTGSWFWWGEKWCTPDEYKQLWQFTHNYLIREKHLTNLVFAYSPAGDFKNSRHYLERYPGNKFVDILGFDIYQNENQTHNAFSQQLSNQIDILNKIAAEYHKIPAITEIGFEQIPYENWWTEVFYHSVSGKGISYALFWRNAANRPNHYYVPYPGQVSEANFKQLCTYNDILLVSKLKKVID
jgi:mannan endo-1,4-beta-mannosidase